MDVRTEAREFQEYKTVTLEELRQDKDAIDADRAAMVAEIETLKKAVDLDRAALEAEKEAMSGYATNDNDMLLVNVGGVPMDVLRATVCHFEGSMLASQFSGRWDATLTKDADERVFLDYDPDEFKLTLKELRRCRMNPQSRMRMPDPSLMYALLTLSSLL